MLNLGFGQSVSLGYHHGYFVAFVQTRGLACSSQALLTIPLVVLLCKACLLSFLHIVPIHTTTATRGISANRLNRMKESTKQRLNKQSLIRFVVNLQSFSSLTVDCRP